MIPVNFRQLRESDLGFLFNSWLKSYREYDNSWAKTIPSSIYFEQHKKVLIGILKISRAVVACSKEDPNQVYGYLVYQPAGRIVILHYCYVKKSFRRFGIAAKMFDLLMDDGEFRKDLPVMCSHSGRNFHRFLKGKFNLIFNPYVLGEELIDETTESDIRQVC